MLQFISFTKTHQLDEQGRVMLCRKCYTPSLTLAILVQIHMNAQIRNREHLQALGIGRIREKGSRR